MSYSSISIVDGIGTGFALCKLSSKKLIQFTETIETSQQHEELKMENTIMDFNMGMNDRVNRFMVGAILIVLSMVSVITPTWIALIALYPILTAIISWDPVYAAYDVLAKIIKSKISRKGGKLALN